ncbi:hypothetical protein BCR35DRAFT_298315 [Leucosporidium creatinivorum]|uniref:Protoporphyrinogen oxidase n=1 Tax=Leucosporidium creatinivorum TaxID=106004 RepID=A0A1Y2G4E0_9BASI|nr:hypothetical protein BCR35DRAFT_298315 [Leucosporidium creatinivorum]
MATLRYMVPRRIAPRPLTLRLSCNAQRIPACSSLRFLSTSSPAPTSTEEPKQTLAIIGGGLSGLSSAFYFLRALSPELRSSTRIVVLEKEQRTGGWCKSIDMNSGAETTLLEKKEMEKVSPKELVFETGPRSIRPVGLQGWLTIEMAHEIGLTPSILTVPKSAPSAKNRYLYTSSGLTKLPSSFASAIQSTITTPLIRSIIPGMLLEPFRPRSPLHSAPNGGDESVDAFFSRRFGKTLAERMLSAMIHGIYAGDSRRLSVRALFPGVWEAEREWGSVIKSALLGGLWRRRGWKEKSEYRLGVERDEVQERSVKTRLARSGREGKELMRRMDGASVWGLRGGLSCLTSRLRSWLEQQGVEIVTGGEATLSQIGERWEVSTPTVTLHPTHIIATSTGALPPSLAPAPVPHTTVSVVNLAFARPPPSSAPLFPPGFGYLIPRSVPASANPHQVLGVIFDSDVMPEVDDSAEEGLVKISVLLGGSYWLDSHPPPDLSHEDLVEAAMNTLRLHLPKTAFPSPAFAFTHTHRDCIPQVPVGYFEEVRTLGRSLRGVQGAKVAVVGGGVAGVGVNGAVKAAWEVGESFALNVTTGGVACTGTEGWE